jgi:beta-lactam-binding protein with PASTA domain
MRLPLSDPDVLNELAMGPPTRKLMGFSVRRILRLVVLGLILVLVAFISALTAMRFAIHGREVAVPQLTGKTTTEAEAVLSNLGLTLEVGNRFFSPNVQEGGIVSQIPESGTKVRRGWRVRVALSLGPQRAAVPNVIGQSGRAAEINVQRRGLELGNVAIVHLPQFPADQVIAQTPPPNSTSLTSPRVNLLVTAPAEAQPYIMPDLVGRSAYDARRAIENAGLRAVRAAGSSPSANSISSADPNSASAWGGYVVRQNPAAGERVSPGTNVVLEIGH